MTAAEIDRVLENCSPHWRAVFRCALTLGARIGEVLALTTDCVEPGPGGRVVVHVRPHTLPNGKEWRPKRPASVRSLLVEPTPELALAADAVGVHWVYDKARTPRAAQLALKKACTLAGVPYNGTHDFRRARIVQALAAGADPNSVASAVGHASLATTMQYVTTGGLVAELPPVDAPATPNPAAAEWLKPTRRKNW